jgi:ribosomal protein S27E
MSPPAFLLQLYIYNRIYVKKQNATKCPKCSNVLTFDNGDVKEINQGAWEEYIVKCPVCGTHIQVCYVNGSWR